MLQKVISGGQTGSDLGALRAAKKCNIPTGGWLPKDCMTLLGPNPDLLLEFNMQEHPKGYRDRTEANVKDSDGTIRIATNFKSAGEVCTLKAIKWHGKPYLDINPKKPLNTEDVAKWIVDNNIQTLNVAGNSESTSNGIEKFVENYLEQVFILCRKTS